jgi:hypothetical protein
VHFGKRDAQVRVIEPDRLNAFFESERVRREKSTVAPEDETAADFDAWKQRFLDAMRIKERAENIVILGFSQFVEPRALDPHDGQLAKFSSKIGGDYAVTSISYKGKVDSVAMLPMTTYARSNTTANAWGPGGHATGIAESSGTATTWVPTRTQTDQYLHFAVVLRRLTADDIAVLRKAYAGS